MRNASSEGSSDSVRSRPRFSVDSTDAERRLAEASLRRDRAPPEGAVPGAGRIGSRGASRPIRLQDCRSRLGLPSMFDKLLHGLALLKISIYVLMVISLIYQESLITAVFSAGFIVNSFSNDYGMMRS
ncbi:hypothetical protein TYRP_009677, partial [Tyrophagus putrescentiae]